MVRKYIGRKSLRQIGEAMVRCGESCPRICNQPENVIVPRCLFLDEGYGPGGAIVVGLNPGKSTQAERSFYLHYGATYESTLAFWEHTVRCNVTYYTKLRRLLEQVGCGGTVLWTELAKCEKEPGFSGALPIQTYRTCSELYLKRELELVPQDWAAFAVGREAFTAAAYLLADRSVVGVPHPTGSRGQFAGICPGGRIAESARKAVVAVLQSETPIAMWLQA